MDNVKSEGKFIKCFHLIVSCPQNNAVIECLPTNNIYQVTEKCIKQFGLKYQKNYHYILRYANEMLDPLMILELSGIPEYSRLVLEKMPHSKIHVDLFDVDNNCHTEGKFNRDENLWNITLQLLSPGNYINKRNACVTYLNIKYIGRQLESTCLSSLLKTKSNIELSLERVYYETPAKTNEENSEKRAAYERFIKQKSESLALLRRKIFNINKEISVSTVKKFEDVYYLGNRSGIAFKSDNVKRSKMSISKLHSYTKYMDTIHGKNGKKSEKAQNDNSTQELSIHFPEGITFKAVFRPDETIAHVCEFIRHYMENYSQHFYIYTVRPRLIMSNDRLLKDINYFPPYNNLYVSTGPSYKCLKSTIIKSFETMNLTKVLCQYCDRQITALKK